MMRATRCTSVTELFAYKYKYQLTKLYTDLDEAAVSQQGSIDLETISPLVSCIIYLKCGSKFPTIVTNQTLAEGSIASEAFVCSPKEGRVVFFDGQLLHGVLPCFLCKEPTYPRITLMLGIWGEHVNTSPPSAYTLSPNMRMPKCCETDWTNLFSLSHTVHPSAFDKQLSGPSKSAIKFMKGNIWEDVAPAEVKNGIVEFISVDSLHQLKKYPKVAASSRKARITQEVIYNGKWFLRSRNELRDEILGFRSTMNERAEEREDLPQKSQK